MSETSKNVKPRGLILAFVIVLLLLVALSAYLFYDKVIDAKPSTSIQSEAARPEICEDGSKAKFVEINPQNSDSITEEDVTHYLPDGQKLDMTYYQLSCD